MGLSIRCCLPALSCMSPSRNLIQWNEETRRNTDFSIFNLKMFHDVSRFRNSIEFHARLTRLRAKFLYSFIDSLWFIRPLIQFFSCITMQRSQCIQYPFGDFLVSFTGGATLEIWRVCDTPQAAQIGSKCWYLEFWSHATKISAYLNISIMSSRKVHHA